MTSRSVHVNFSSRYQGKGHHSRSLVFSFGLSLVFHLAVIGALMYIPKPAPRLAFSSSVVNVDLVSLPDQNASSGAAGFDKIQPAVEDIKPLPSAPLPKAPAKEVMPIPEKPAPEISLAPKPEPKPKPAFTKKKSLKKKTIDRTKIRRTAIDKIEEKVTRQESDSVAQALERLKKQVAAAESSSSRGAGQPEKESGSAGGAGAAVFTRGGAPVSDAVRIYQAEIQYQIQKNWAFSPQLAGQSKDLEAVLGIKILPGGEIDDIWFDKKSGNAYLDDSAFKAVIKSNPLPPLPPDLAGGFYKIGLIFGPKGLK